jgi:hypothetical protein
VCVLLFPRSSSQFHIVQLIINTHLARHWTDPYTVTHSFAMSMHACPYIWQVNVCIFTHLTIHAYPPIWQVHICLPTHLTCQHMLPHSFDKSIYTAPPTWHIPVHSPAYFGHIPNWATSGDPLPVGSRSRDVTQFGKCLKVVQNGEESIDAVKWGGLCVLIYSRTHLTHAYTLFLHLSSANTHSPTTLRHVPNWATSRDPLPTGSGSRDVA